MNFTKEFNGCKTTVTFVSYPTVIIKVTKSTTAITRQYYKRKIYDTKGKKKIIKKTKYMEKWQPHNINDNRQLPNWKIFYASYNTYIS